MFKVEFKLEGNKLVAEVPDEFLELLPATTREILEKQLERYGYVMIDKQAATIGKFHLVEEEHALGNIKIKIKRS